VLQKVERKKDQMSEQGAVQVRLATAADVGGLQRLFNDASGEACVRMAATDGALVAVADGEIVGIASCDASDQVAVFVAAAWRGRGVGRLLANAMGRPSAATAVLGDVA
jgi:GNAT superfamily N-acetyltransferase